MPLEKVSVSDECGEGGVANSVGPLHKSIWYTDTELMIVIDFFQDCRFERAFAVNAILRADELGIFF